MNTPALTTHTSGMEARPAGAAPQTIERPDFRTVYDAWFHEVCRWLRALGGPGSDLEDLAQEVFLVVLRKLSTFDGGNLPGWLYRITARTMSDHRRRAWWKNLLRRRDTVLEELASPAADPAAAVEQREAERQLFVHLRPMSEKRRTVLVLHDIEGYSSEEIGALHGVPAATVRTRLHHARKELAARLSAARRKERR